MQNEQQTITVEPDEERHGKRVYLSFAALVGMLLLFFFFKTNWEDHVPVRQIIIDGTAILSREDVLQTMQLPAHAMMYDIDLAVIRKNILNNAYVKNVTVKRDAPSSLRVLIEERQPSAILVIKNQDKTYYVDNEGVILPYSVTQETYDIPVISGVDTASELKPGMKITNTDIQTALEIIRASYLINEELYHRISEIHLRKGHDIILYSFESAVPIIFGQGDVVKKMAKLNEFWKQVVSRMETKNIRYIDLRYEEQVILSNYNSSL